MGLSPCMSPLLAFSVIYLRQRPKRKATGPWRRLTATCFSLIMKDTSDANAGSKLPDPMKAGVVEKLFRLDCGRSLANDESVWTPGEKAQNEAL